MAVGQMINGRFYDLLDAQAIAKALSARPCWQCPERPTRMFCYGAEPWRPYCPKHPPQYGTAGDLKLRVFAPERSEEG